MKPGASTIALTGTGRAGGRFLVCLACLQVGALLTSPALAHADDDCVFRCPTRPGLFGSPEPDPNCVRQCIEREETVPSGKTTPPAPTTTPPAEFRFTEAWNKDKQWQQQRTAVERLVSKIPDGTFTSWVRKRILFDRISRGQMDFRAGILPGRLHVYDPFWADDFSDSGRMNILTFELAKGLWFDKINPAPREARPAAVVEFERLVTRHQRTIQAMRFASLRKEDLAYLTDNDLQSQFAYACRVELLGLDPPDAPPPGYSETEWAGIRRDWPLARLETGRYLMSLLREYR